MQQNLIELISITKSYSNQRILSEINLQIKEGEIIAIVGKSGCGKSTLLRIIAGLTQADSGEIKFANPDNPPSINMVFQTFALFPWLNILENVEIGLRSQNILNADNKKHVQQFIKLMGLEGFEQAMPRELSGGMKQRVSLARGLTMNPDILILDEPFTTLDVLTANNLKNDFLKLWEEQLTSLKSVIMVTHSIEEALEMADYIIVLGNSPAQILTTLPVDLERPRNIKSEEFQEKVELIFEYMTNANSNIAVDKTKEDKFLKHESSLARKLPIATVSDMIALVKLLNTPEHNKVSNIRGLATSLVIKMSMLMSMIEGLAILKFAEINEDDVVLTKDGEIFASAIGDEQKEIFVKHLYKYVPLTTYILKIIKERQSHEVHKERFKTYIEDYMTPEESTITLNTIINWGRFGEIFSYDDNKQIFSLKNLNLV